MGIKGFFGRFGQRGQSSDQFANWPPVPVVRQPGLGRVGRLAVLPSQKKAELNPRKYGPTLVFGLGKSGEFVLQQWLDRLTSDPAGFQERIRPILLTHTPVDEIYSDVVHFRQFDLTSNSRRLPSEFGRNLNLRKQAHELFRESETFEPFWTYVGTVVQELTGGSGRGVDIRVLIVASALEAEAGIIGDVLQTLRILDRKLGSTARFSTKTLLLSLTSPDPTLSEKDLFPVLREIGRFTFTDSMHWMSALPIPGERSGVVRQALLEYVFLLEAAKPPAAQINLQQLHFNDGVGAALVEALFTLAHPSAKDLWENLKNDLADAGAARTEAHVAFVNALGIVSLYVPVSRIEAYAAARLAYAALFGEQMVPEGLIPQRRDYTYGDDSGLDVREQLGAKHPLYRWVLEATGTTSFRKTPNLNRYREFIGAFQMAVAERLLDLLNAPDISGQIDRARHEMIWLTKRLKEVAVWSEAAREHENSEDHERLQVLITHWGETTSGLLRQLELWQNVLIGDGKIQENSAESTLRPQPTPQTGGLLDLLAGHSTPQVDKQSLHKPEPAKAPTGSLLAQLIQVRKSAEADIVSLNKARIRLPLTANSGSGLVEVDKYYRDTIRPEMESHEDDEQVRFNRVRERLAWWIDLPKGAEPKIYIVCLGVDKAGNGEDATPPYSALFTPDKITELRDAVLSVACHQVQDVSSHLTGEWMKSRMGQQPFGKHLETANKPFLDFDQGAATDISYHAATPRRYVIGRDKTLTEPLKRAAFPFDQNSGVNDLIDADPRQLTALGLRLNIPIQTIKALANDQQYVPQEDLYLYKQEIIATRYESRFSAIRVKQPYPLPPELTMCLVDQRLTTLFCQAVFCQLIMVAQPNPMSNERFWLLPDLDKQHDQQEEDDVMQVSTIAARTLYSLDAESYQGKEWISLWLSLRFFVLESPHDPDLNSDYSHPLNRSNHKQYVDALLAAARAIRGNPQEFDQMRTEFERNYLNKWQNELFEDELGRAFLDLLRIELNRPMWKSF